MGHRHRSRSGSPSAKPPKSKRRSGSSSSSGKEERRRKKDKKDKKEKKVIETPTKMETRSKYNLLKIYSNALLILNIF